MYCTQCGSELSEQASFCSECGTPRYQPDVDDPYSDTGLAARGFKLCVSCRSEIRRDARICDRCDAHQPTEVPISAPLPLPDVQQDFSTVVVEQPPTLQIATVPRRMAAFAIDFVILVILLVPIAYFISENALLVVSAIVTVCYPLIMEAMFSQTVGKMVLKIRVVTDEYERIDWKKSAGRNVLRLVDQLPVFYILGMIVMGVSDKNQRLGDLAARTLVVNDFDSD